MNIVKFEATHLERMKVQERQSYLSKYLKPEAVKILENAKGDAFAALDGEEVIAVAGVCDIGEGRGMAWSYLSQDIGARFIAVTKATKRYLAIAPYRRIEMTADCDFAQAHRWAKMLGFEIEATRMKQYSPDGRDCALYAMVK